MELIGRMNAELDQQSWSSWSGGMSSANYYLSTDESYVSGNKVRYHFSFGTLSGTPYTVTWTVRTYFNSGGSSDSSMSATVTGNGGQITVGDYEISPPGQNGYATVVDYQVSYQSPWNPWTLATAPSLSISANSPGNQCIATSVSVTADVSTSSGSKTRLDSCGNSESTSLSLSTPSVTWTVSGVSASPQNGTSSTAIFMPTSAGTCTVTFNATATTVDPNGNYSASSATSFTVINLLALNMSSNDGITFTTTTDSAGNLVVLVPYTTSTTAKIYASLTYTPAVECDSLPACLTFTGGDAAGCPKSFRKVNRDQIGKTDFIANCCGAQQVKVTVIVFRNSFTAIVDKDGAQAEFPHAWWRIDTIPAEARAYIPANLINYHGEAGFFPNAESGWYQTYVISDGKVVMGNQGPHPVQASHTWFDQTWSQLISGLEKVKYLDESQNYQWFNFNCVSGVHDVGASMGVYGLPVLSPGELYDFLINQ